MTLRTGSAAYGPRLRHRTLLVFLEHSYIRRLPWYIRLATWGLCAAAAGGLAGWNYALAGPLVFEFAFLLGVTGKYAIFRKEQRRQVQELNREKGER